MSAISESISLPDLEGCYPGAVQRDSLKGYNNEKNQQVVDLTAIARKVCFIVA
jgi:hypothetical protein